MTKKRVLSTMHTLTRCTFQARRELASCGWCCQGTACRHCVSACYYIRVRMLLCMPSCGGEDGVFVFIAPISSSTSHRCTNRLLQAVSPCREFSRGLVSTSRSSTACQMSTLYVCPSVCLSSPHSANCPQTFSHPTCISLSPPPRARSLALALALFIYLVLSLLRLPAGIV
jgi:hypothetical protein